MADDPVPEPDVLEQQRPADPGAEADESRVQELQAERSRQRTDEAPEADLLEQAEPVGPDDNDEDDAPRER